MLDPNQTSTEGDSTAAPPAPPPGVGRSLAVWLLLLVLFGVGGVLLGEQELALLAALAGLFVLANAADTDRIWGDLASVTGLAISALAFIVSLAVGAAIWQSTLPTVARALLLLYSAGVAGFAMLTLPGAVADRLCRALFRSAPAGHVLRLTARSVTLTFAIALPAWFAAQSVMDEMLAAPEPFMDRVGLGGSLIGYVLLAFAGVGWGVRRDFGAAARRLGLVVPGVKDLGIAVVALGVLWAINNGADLLQQRWLPGLWASDRHVTEAIASGMGPGRALMLGLSAGIGEEISLRGGLQPRLGIVLTSAFFAALHVQYSWYGMLVILALGLVLGLTRRYSSTSAAMIAHIAYDVMAVLAH